MYPYTLGKKSNLTDYARDLLAQELFWSRAQEEQWRQSLKATLYSLRKLALQHIYVEAATRGRNGGLFHLTGVIKEPLVLPSELRGMNEELP